jgi:hypothetical protein
MRSMASMVAIAAILAAAPARGFDANGTDILGLRLGMEEPEIIARLKSQGYFASGTSDAIMADTKDGQLQVMLTAGRGATEIRYAFTGHRMNEPAVLRESVMLRFGDPNQAKPPAWCRAVGSDGRCPADQASLTFLPQALTLILKSEAP